MPTIPETKPVEDTVPKVNDEIAVGSDPEFQHRWWRMENTIWILFGVFIVLDLLGFFGRGPFANAQQKASDGSITVDYERIERFGTPSILTLHFSPSVVHDGKIQLWVNDTMIKPLGAQRVIPQPSTSVTGDGGMYYTVPATANPNSVGFAMQPASVGLQTLTLRVPGSELMTLKIMVMP